MDLLNEVSQLRTERPGQPGVRTRPELRPERAPDPGLLYGRNAVLEALRGRRRPRHLILAEGIKFDERIRDIVSLTRSRAGKIDRLPREQLDLLLPAVNHQGVALHATEYPYAPIAEIAVRQGTVVVLDHLQDPQNLGTLIRAAEAAGVAGVIIPKDRAAEITPAVVNASSGAVEHVLVAQEPNLPRAIESLKLSGRWALALDTGSDALDLYESDLPLPAILVVGSEGSGLTPIVQKACDAVVQIPMTGRVASLNAATAGSLAIFELLRRERITGL